MHEVLSRIGRRRGGHIGFAQAAADLALAGNTLRVIHLVATDAPTRARLWRYCLDVDLMARVSFENLPLDDPMRWMLRDPRRLRM